MPSISRSPFSLELTVICGRARARVRSASSAGPDRSNGLSGPPPWGFTSFDTGFLPVIYWNVNLNEPNMLPHIDLSIYFM